MVISKILDITDGYKVVYKNPADPIRVYSIFHSPVNYVSNVITVFVHYEENDVRLHFRRLVVVDDFGIFDRLIFTLSITAFFGTFDFI